MNILDGVVIAAPLGFLVSYVFLEVFIVLGLSSHYLFKRYVDFLDSYFEREKTALFCDILIALSASFSTGGFYGILKKAEYTTNSVLGKEEYLFILLWISLTLVMAYRAYTKSQKILRRPTLKRRDDFT